MHSDSKICNFLVITDCTRTHPSTTNMLRGVQHFGVLSAFVHRLRTVFSFVIIFFPLFILGNAAPPGFWGAGHGSTIIPIFKNDSAAIAQVQMQRELILVDLHKNYAVVKGTYWFYNHSSKKQRIRTGYPINGENYAHGVDIVRFDDLYHLQVKINGNPTASVKLSEYDSIAKQIEEINTPNGFSQIGNWYIWEMQFEPLTTTRLEVYFIVRTPTTLTQGYGKKYANAFEYIVQTGASWKDRIMQGDIIVTLKDGLTTKDIFGVYPKNKVNHTDTQLHYRFNDLKPKAEDDLIIWYQGIPDSSIALLKPLQLFSEIEQTDTSILRQTGLKLMEKDDFDTPMPEWSWLLIGGVVLGLALSLAITGRLIYLLYKVIKKIFK